MFSSMVLSMMVLSLRGCGGICSVFSKSRSTFILSHFRRFVQSRLSKATKRGMRSRPRSGGQIESCLNPSPWNSPNMWKHVVLAEVDSTRLSASRL